MIADAEIWQVTCGGEVYQADLDTLKQWVAEGLVQPADQVRKGNLRWLDAGRVPALRRIFTGEETFTVAAPPAPDPSLPPAEQHAAAPSPDAFAAPSPDAFAAPRFAADPARYAPETSHYAVATSGFTPEAAGYAPDPSPFAAAGAAPETFGLPASDPFYVPPVSPATAHDAEPARAEDAPRHGYVPDRRDFAERAGAAPSLRSLGRACYNHPQLPPRYVCRVCQTPMCAPCAKYVEGGSVALCPLCGDFCKDYSEVWRRARGRARKSSGFGLGDFGEAVGYPFRNLVGLVGVSLFYSLLSLGGIKGQIFAFVVIFGCMSLVIKQLAWGRTDRGFLPDFSSMSLWDDAAVPCFLGIGVTLITWGAAIVLFIALVWGVFAGAAKQPGMGVQHPGLAMHEEQFSRRGPDEFLEAHERQFRGGAQDATNHPDPQNSVGGLERAETAGSSEGPEAVEAGAAEGQEAALARRLLSGAMGPALVLIPLIIVALLWGFFYYPMALIVAGYTEDFWAVVNPLVGFDTIRRMGWNYIKVFLMYAVVQLSAIVAGVFVSYALSAFEMPFFGNIPARFIQGGINFYTSLVIAALLGLALYKSSDRLGIETD